MKVLNVTGIICSIISLIIALLAWFGVYPNDIYDAFTKHINNIISIIVIFWIIIINILCFAAYNEIRNIIPRLACTCLAFFVIYSVIGIISIISYLC
ncbi:MAG: hypothetical protein LBM93_03240 [Oscillospiraceae bacterium]|jgi:fumarate reductase subunit D|nr:hypothetical protein [Oscillospiraceae bacterium]